MFIELYTADSTLGRVIQLDDDYEMKVQAADIARVHAAEVSIRLMNLVLNGLNGIYHGRLPDRVVDHMREFQKRMLPTTDIIAIKRRIAEHVYAEKKYPF